MENGKIVEEILKADFDEKPVEEICKAAKLTEKAATTLKAVARLLNGCKEELPEEMKKSVLPQLMKAVGYDYGYPEPKEPKKKDDGSYDLEGVPDAVRQPIEALWKANQDTSAELVKITKERDDTAKKLSEEINARVLKEYIAKAAEFKHLPIKPEEYGPVLKTMAEKDPEGYKKHIDVLKAADEGNAKLFSEHGVSGENNSGEDKMAPIMKAAEAIMKEDKTLTREQAIASALKANPQLYNAYRNA